MENNYTTLVTDNIPNEQVYDFCFQLNRLCYYNGPENLDKTIDDQLLCYITEPLLNNQIEYNFRLVWNEKDTADDTLSVILKVNGDKFDPQMVVDNLKVNSMEKDLTISRIY
jgi:hypothetical protein